MLLVGAIASLLALALGTGPAPAALGPGSGPPSLEFLYRRYAPAVVRRVRRLLPGEDAEEVAHEVFMRIAERLHLYQQQAEQDSPLNWVYTITTRYCLNRRRDAARRRDLMAEQAPVFQQRQVSRAEQEERTLLMQLFDQLDDEQRMVATLHWVDDLSHARIGQMLGCSARTVGYRLESIREVLQARAQREQS